MSDTQLQFHTWVIANNQNGAGKIGIIITCIKHGDSLVVTKEHLHKYGIPAESAPSDGGSSE